MPILNMIYWATWWGGWWWQPWANTIAYYPLTSTTQWTDQSWNGRDLTNSGVTFWTYQWVDCWQFNWGWLLSYNLTIPTDWTIIWWVYHDNVSENQVAFDIWWALATGRDCLGYYYNPGSDYIVLWQFHWWYETGRSINITGQWTNVCITYTAGNDVLYINWLPMITRSDTISFRSDIWLWTFDQSTVGLYWWMSNIIFEDKVRTVQEIIDYYNQTKWNYWIS